MSDERHAEWQRHAEELLGHLVYSHGFRSEQAAARCRQLLGRLRELREPPAVPAAPAGGDDASSTG
jgi:hypothetical protein